MSGTVFAIQERAVSENPDAGPQGKGWQEDIAFTLEARNKVQAVCGVASGASSLPANDNYPAAPEHGLRFLSVCSGIEAASVAWHPLGWRAVAFAEIEKFPSAVLAHHYPDVPNLGDMTKFEEWPDYAIELLCGGTPCQSFSIGGLRKGLEDPRGSLMLTYLAIARRYRPRLIVWENVVGVLSSNGGRDFGTFLGGLAECGYGFAYRVLDAKFFGSPQQRRRVVVVGCLGNAAAAAKILFEQEGPAWRPTPKRTEILSVCLTARGPGSLDDRETYVVDGHGVRHLTPLEHERIQGFPDGYTNVQFNGKPAADQPRSKALGNSWAVPKFVWLGKRITALMPPIEANDDIIAKAAA